MKRLPRTLSPVETRVLGALLEKEQATPAYYPMTVNGLLQACNQKSNRSPVMNLSGSDVQTALDSLFEEDVFAWRSRAGRTVKWKQNVDRRWHLAPATKAIITLLMLRGPQTIGELRLRSERLHTFDDLAAVESALAVLADGEEPLVRELHRQPGQKEARWMHLLGDEEATAAAIATSAVGATAPARSRGAAADRLEQLEQRVTALEELVGSLGKRLGEDPS